MDERVHEAFRQWSEVQEQEHVEPDRDTAIAYLHVLRGVLHYHERMTLAKKESISCKWCDIYSDALREAIRCLQQKHRIEGE